MAATTTEAVISAPPAPPTCSWTDHSTGPCKLVVINHRGSPVQLVWLSYDGAEQVYNVLESGAETHQDTYSTHVWELKDEDGKRLVQYAGPSAKLYVTSAGVTIVGTPPPPPADAPGPSGSGAAGSS
ncbi:hypothetical protein CHLRE_08g374350v5 [Chlamydomonas reinhardtii]|uniref:von Hippel-Lindau disease tumour suppressor beta domain-containing protein n=1 Tax=Chlamydomonas reinhardtii TaxID=3055 RepID=A0A2K3DHK7_CHLRE|nr:uncharacterized protein CHLRE_08g374350v5 [Chlamydomonas reinhardtii]PNW80016.1 hypothetical protein CHLRE_08g374350v5 [Chlamydomonas reinhardtii]